MAIIKPFRALRPSRDKVHLVASRAFDTYSTSELNGKLAANPYSFLHIIKPDFGDEFKGDNHSVQYLKKIKANFQNFISEEYLIQEKTPALYVYEQFKDNQTYIGIIGCASIQDYFDGVIKIHEQTITDKEEKFKDYLEICDFNAEPVCIAYPDNEAINKLISDTMLLNPEYDFSTRDRERHKLWCITEPEKINVIVQEFEKLNAVYIADGHHRTASSALLGKAFREQNKNSTGEESYNFFMCIFFAEKQLHIFDFNRAVRDLNGLDVDEFIQKLEEKFLVEKKGAEIYSASKLHNMSMYVQNNWYSLTAKPGTYHSNDPVGSLDASILSEHILSPILGIKDLKTDKRIKFVSGIKGMKELKSQVDSERMKVAFGLYPVSMKQLKDVADNNCIMPPKTTWIEPKLRSGLVIYSLS